MCREGSKHAMKEFAAKLTGQLSELTTMVCAARSPPSPLAWLLLLLLPACTAVAVTPLARPALCAD